MEITRPCPLAERLAARIRESRDELTARWLDRIADQVSLDPDRIFPSDELLDHVPVLMTGVADYLEDPSDEITADVPVIAKAMELGELRFAQGFDATEILKEYEILGGVLFAFCAEAVAQDEVPPPADEVLACSHRLFRAVSVIEQATAAHYLRVMYERVGEREERLRRFSRMITHELKNRVGATMGAAQLLQEEWLGDDERRKFAGIIDANAQEIQKVLENLVALSRLDGERRRQRNIQLGEIVEEVFRQQRGLARARQVELRVAGAIPPAEVPAAAVELCLSNYLSNAIRYSDPASRARYAEVQAEFAGDPHCEGGCELVIRVRDNGLGVPEDKRDRLFERFFRAHEDTTSVEGTGLGLNLVRETVESLGGKAWAEPLEGAGSVFAFSLPCNRVEGGAAGDDAVSCGSGASAGHGASSSSARDGRRRSREDAAPGTASG
ncbi:MAG TPA: sensor histidine kinase [Longimicrobiales bacterium]|nr:sensor histidine kinase [Longimicrobiales bacterium]